MNFIEIYGLGVLVTLIASSIVFRHNEVFVVTLVSVFLAIFWIGLVAAVVIAGIAWCFASMVQFIEDRFTYKPKDIQDG